MLWLISFTTIYALWQHTHTHTLSYREYTHNRTEHTTFFLPNTIHTIHHCPSDVIRNSTRLTYSQPRPFLPSFPPSLKQTHHHSLFFFPSTQNHTRAKHNPDTRAEVRRKTPPFFEFPRENPRNAGAPCFSLSRISIRSDSMDRSGFRIGPEHEMEYLAGIVHVSSCILLNTFFGVSGSRGTERENENETRVSIFIW